MPRPPRPPAAGWAAVVAATVAATGVCVAVRLPSPTLFGALAGGIAYAVATPARWPGVTLPRPAVAVGQGLVGASMGVFVDAPTLRELAGHWAPIGAICLATLLASVLVGLLFAVRREVSRATGVFALIAGGASGITAVAGELGADDRVVSIVQYLRVLLILVGMPLVTAVVFAPPPGRAVAPAATYGAGLPLDLLFTVGCLAGGLALARRIHVPAATLLLPLFVAATLTATGLAHGAHVPSAVEAAGFALIGWQVGLRFTRAALVAIARLLPAAVALLLLLIAISAGLGVVLAAWTGVSALDGYLATTPGGLYAVLATAAASGADVTFVLSVQVVRLILMLAAAPLLAAALRRHV